MVINVKSRFTTETRTQLHIISILLNCAFDRTPKLFATAAAFGRVGHYAVVVEHACNVPQVLSQLVVRKLIGFRGNNYSGLVTFLKPFVKLQILFCGFVARIYELN